MNWTPVLIFAVLLAAIFLLKRSGQIPLNEAQARLKNGALLIDVRTAAEYSSGHLPNAISLPLNEIEEALPRRVEDKSQSLLLHCQSGMRSGVACRKLKALGYANAFNLGSYDRAAHLLKQI